jgi:hypothetical protein
MINKILKAVTTKPTTIIVTGDGGCIAWNTAKYYCDVEISSSTVEFTISKNRTNIEFIETDFDNIEFGIEKLCKILNCRI